MKRKYNTDEERIAAQREAIRRWKTAHPDYFKQYRQVNKEKLAAQHAKYRQNNKEKIATQQSEWKQNNKEKYVEYQAEWRQNNKEKKAEYYQNNKEKITEYRQTKKGRALSILNSYKFNDKKYNRGECTLTDDWIVEHIFNNPCHYCGETDWHELGCDRKDSSLPHTPDNVVPCCRHCNCKKGVTPYNEYMRLIGKIT